MPKSDNALFTAINAAGSDKKIPVMHMVRRPEEAALLSKLVQGSAPTQYDARGNHRAIMPDLNDLHGVSNNTTTNITDSRIVMQVLPDIKLAAQVLVTSVLSPKDMMDAELTYVPGESPLPNELLNNIIISIRQHFETNYKIKQLLARQLTDILFETGSYVMAVIPENALDDIISGQNGTVTMESFSGFFDKSGNASGLGILGSADNAKPTTSRTVLESIMANTHFAPEPKVVLEGLGEIHTSVTDNHAILKLPTALEELRRQSISTRIQNAAPRQKAYNDRSIEAALYRPRQTSFAQIVSVKTDAELQRRSVGKPLILHLPSESVIPAHVPGMPEKHIGAYVLLDMEGNPIVKARDTDYVRQLQSSFANSQNGLASQLIKRVGAEMGTGDQNGLYGRKDVDRLVRNYGAMMSSNLTSRLRNGLYGDGIELSIRDEAYYLMLSRSLENKSTQILFIPYELMTYMAFQYNARGVGESMIDDMKFLASLRSILQFVNVAGALRNSIGRTEVNCKLDPEDPNPEHSMERAMHEVIKTRAGMFPAGVTNPSDIASWAQSAGLEFSFEGHPGVPDVSVDFGEKSSSFNKADGDLTEELRKSMIMGFGLAPEVVDNAFQSEFATSVVTNNLLLAKRVMQIQDTYLPFLDDIHHKIALHDSTLVSKVFTMIRDNWEEVYEKLKGNKDYVLPEGALTPEQITSVISKLTTEVLSTFTVKLPRPNSATHENQMAALSTYEELLDKALDSYISTDIITSDTSGDISQYVDAIKAIAKSYFLRKFMTENGILPELNELVSKDEKGRPNVDFYKENAEHTASLSKSFAYFMQKINATKEAIDNVESERTGDEAGSYDSPEGGGGDDSSGEGGDEFGSEGMGGLDDIGSMDGDGGDEEPAADDPEAEPEAEAEPEVEVEPKADPEPEADKKDEEKE